MMWTRIDYHEYSISAMRREQQPYERRESQSYLCMMRMLGLSFG